MAMHLFRREDTQAKDEERPGTGKRLPVRETDSMGQGEGYRG